MATQTFKDVHEFVRVKGKELLDAKHFVKTNNKQNEGTLKEQLLELPHQFFCIENPASTIFNLKSFKTQPWWFVGEILSEFLALNPPVMSKYRQDIIDESYKLMPNGTLEYMYGNRWQEHRQIDNIVARLQKNPTSKRCIIQTWMPEDSENNRNDVPCNTNYMFLSRNGKLDMTATIRSNDILRGSRYDYGLAGFMQQSIASLTNLEVGNLYFHINSLHCYFNDMDKLEQVVKESKSNKTPAVKLEIPLNLSSKEYWHHLRHVKKAEEASYCGGFEYFDKNLNDMTIPVFRDFARIYGIKNAKNAKNEELANKLKSELELSEMQRWCK